MSAEEKAIAQGVVTGTLYSVLRNSGYLTQSQCSEILHDILSKLRNPQFQETLKQGGFLSSIEGK